MVWKRCDATMSKFTKDNTRESFQDEQQFCLKVSGTVSSDVVSQVPGRIRSSVKIEFARRPPTLDTRPRRK